MWTRRELKQKAKAALRGNYWKAVFISIIMLLVTSGAGAAGSMSGFTSGLNLSPTSGYSEDSEYEEYADIEDEYFDEDTEFSESNTEYDSVMNESLDEILEETSGDETDAGVFTALGILIILIIVVILLVVIVAVAAIIMFVLGPVEIGAKRFFVKDLSEKAEVKEIAYGYDHGYMRNVVTLILMQVYTMLWSLLLIIPGIVKSYEYSMIPYLLGEHPEMSRKEAFRTSKEMMRGNKWRAFVLDLSFIGWRILALFTLGILNTFYVNPYYNLTKAALYQAIAEEHTMKFTAPAIAEQATDNTAVQIADVNGTENGDKAEI